MRFKRSIMVAGNWKMHMKVGEASRFMHRIEEKIPIRQNIEVVLMPNDLALQPISVNLDRRKFRLGAQNGYFEDFGAYTGEVSMAMLHDIVHYVLVGHSERRHIFGENDDLVAKKVQAAVRNDIMPILCVGETATDRANKETNHMLHRQISSGLIHLTSRQAGAVVVAYEPVWAIGSGVVPTAAEIQKELGFIRKQVSDLHGERAAKNLRILYGGSVNPGNISEILGVENCDGVLVGGASLDSDDFAKIAESAYQFLQQQ